MKMDNYLSSLKTLTIFHILISHFMSGHRSGCEQVLCPLPDNNKRQSSFCSCSCTLCVDFSCIVIHSSLHPFAMFSHIHKSILSSASYTHWSVYKAALNPFARLLLLLPWFAFVLVRAKFIIYTRASRLCRHNCSVICPDSWINAKTPVEQRSRQKQTKKKECKRKHSERQFDDDNVTGHKYY